MIRKRQEQGLRGLVQSARKGMRAWARRRYWHALDPKRYPAALAGWYRRATGGTLDLDNPATFDEKLQWIKLYDSTPEKGMLSDKYLVRDWVADRVGAEYLVPLLGAWTDAQAIDFDALPDRFVLKAAHGCGWNIVVEDKSSIDQRAVRNQLSRWLATDYSLENGLELQYRFCERRIIAEEYLENRPGDLYDYKFFCFKGKAFCVGFIRGRSAHSEEACFDRNWKLLPCVYYTHPRITEDVEKPVGFERALAVAETLAAGFEHVRVDLYILNDGSVKFGEMTFTTVSGASLWDPPEYNYAFGELIDMSAYPMWRKMHTP